MYREEKGGVIGFALGCASAAEVTLGARSWWCVPSPGAVSSQGSRAEGRPGASLRLLPELEELLLQQMKYRDMS